MHPTDLPEQARRYLYIHSTLLFVGATVLQMTLHEAGHFLAAIIAQAKDVVPHHNYVANTTDGLPAAARITIAGAGPAVSLLTGLLFHLICALRRQRDMAFLFCLYLSVFGYIAFWGYLIIAPVFTYGDTGYILSTLGAPAWVVIAFAMASGGMLYLIMRQLIRYFVSTGTAELVADRQLRRSFLNYLVRYPLFTGIVLTALLNLPAPTPLSLIYPLCSPFCIMWGFRKGLSDGRADKTSRTHIQRSAGSE